MISYVYAKCASARNLMCYGCKAQASLGDQMLGMIKSKKHEQLKTKELLRMMKSRRHEEPLDTHVNSMRKSLHAHVHWGLRD